MVRIIVGLVFLVVGYVAFKIALSVFVNTLLWCAVGAALLGAGFVAAKRITKKKD